LTKKILIIRLSSLGDIILTEPLTRALREKYADAEIDFLVKKEFKGIIDLFETVSNVLIYDETVLPKGYDVVLDIHNVLRTRRIRRGLGKKLFVINKRTFKRWLLVKFKINLLRGEPDVIGRYFETVKDLGVRDAGIAPLIKISAVREKKAAICPGAKHWNKQWPIENFIEVAKELSSRGYGIEVHGSKQEHELGEKIIEALPVGTVNNLCGILTLEELAKRIASYEVAITNDSGLMHLANAVGTRTISIFGPTVSEFGFFSRNKAAVILENNNLDCRPCTTIGLDHCPKGHFKCMKEISPELALHSVV
jgi:heptosyltransferase-2